MKAILFVGHGSRDTEGNEQVRQFIENMTPRLASNLVVETCFLEFAAPNVAQGLGTCVEKGAKQVAVIPIMLLPAGHSKIHIPAEIDRAREKYPHVEFTYGKPIGTHHQVLEILKDRLAESGENLQESTSDTAIILLGRGGSDADANSDLYKISRLLWEQVSHSIVEPAFMGVTNPSLDAAVERTIKLGARRIVILPYFLFTGILIKRLEEMVVRYQEQYPELEFVLAGYFGFHPNLEIILTDRAEEALKGEVKMNCDTCQYRLEAMEHIGHHHHHDHDHNHSHHHHHDHDHDDHAHHHHEEVKLPS